MFEWFQARKQKVNQQKQSSFWWARDGRGNRLWRTLTCLQPDMHRCPVVMSMIYTYLLYSCIILHILYYTLDRKMMDAYEYWVLIICACASAKFLPQKMKLKRTSAVSGSIWSNCIMTIGVRWFFLAKGCNLWHFSSLGRDWPGPWNCENRCGAVSTIACPCGATLAKRS